jgi:hypothetical protein
VSPGDLEKDPAFDRHYARVLLTEAKRRRGQPFAATLLSWARAARLRSHGAPRQLDLL